MIFTCDLTKKFSHSRLTVFSSHLLMSPVTKRLVAWPEHKSLNKQAIPVPGTKQSGQSRTCL